jgi:hypothetical protein
VIPLGLICLMALGEAITYRTSFEYWMSKPFSSLFWAISLLMLT